MLLTSVLLFLGAAIAGAIMAIKRAQTNENPPLPISFVHGPLAVAGYIVLLVYLFQYGFATLPTVAAGLLTLAALGGATLIITHLRGSRISFPLVVGHALCAVSGVVVLLITIVLRAS